MAHLWYLGLLFVIGHWSEFGAYLLFVARVMFIQTDLPSIAKNHAFVVIALSGRKS